MRPVPAGRQRGQCCTPYSRLQEEIDNVETIAVTANNTANNAMTAATIQAGNAAQSAQDAQNSADAAAASAAAVAGALDDKVDKLTTANLKAYTHNGSTQGEKAIVDGTTADTIPIRDANGYVQGATNTTGTRDNVLTNGTRVQNDLDNYASMVRTSGNQTISGNKTFTGHTINLHPSYNLPSTMPRVAGTGWVKMYETTYTNHVNGIFAVLPRRATSTPGFGIIACGGHGGNGTVLCKWMSSDLINSGYTNGIMVTIETNLITIWAKNISATDTCSMRQIADVANGTQLSSEAGWTEATDRTIYTMTDDGQGNYTGYVDSDSVVHTFISYEVSS